MLPYGLHATRKTTRLFYVLIAMRLGRWHPILHESSEAHRLARLPSCQNTRRGLQSLDSFSPHLSVRLPSPLPPLSSGIYGSLRDSGPPALGARATHTLRYCGLHFSNKHIGPSRWATPLNYLRSPHCTPTTEPAYRGCRAGLPVVLPRFISHRTVRIACEHSCLAFSAACRARGASFSLLRGKATSSGGPRTSPSKGKLSPRTSAPANGATSTLSPVTTASHPCARSANLHAPYPRSPYGSNFRKSTHCAPPLCSAARPRLSDRVLPATALVPTPLQCAAHNAIARSPAARPCHCHRFCAPRQRTLTEATGDANAYHRAARCAHSVAGA